MFWDFFFCTVGTSMREKSNLLNDIVLLSWSTLGQSAPATGAHSIEGLAPALNFSVAIFMTWLLIIPLTSWKDESTPVLSLAILKCTRSCPLRIIQCYPQENVVVILFYNKSFDYLLTLLRSQDIGPHSFFCVHFHQPQLCNMQKLAKIPAQLSWLHP